jgi:hypothetical protein
MWIVVLIGIALVVLFWQYILAGLALWVSLSIVRALINLAAADPKPTYPRKPVQTRPVAKPVQTRPIAKRVQTGPAAKPKPEPVCDLPAPDYLPRWNPGRRQDVGRELAQWQKDFDSAAQ